MAYTTPPVVVTGQLWTAANQNQYLRDNFIDVAAYKGVKVIRTTNQNIAGSTLTAVSFDTEDHDTDAFHAGGAPTRLTVPAGLDGYYQIYAAVMWSGATSLTDFDLYIRKNGAVYLAHISTAGETPGVSQVISLVASLSATDYIEVIVHTTIAETLEAVNVSLFAGMYLLRS